MILLYMYINYSQFRVVDDDLYEGTEVFSALWTGLEDSNVKQAPFTLTIMDNDSEPVMYLLCVCSDVCSTDRAMNQACSFALYFQ